MRTFAALLVVGCMLVTETSPAATVVPGDFAYRMRVIGTTEAAAYRVVLPLAVYQKIYRPDLADLRVFNGNDEQVPFAIERPAATTLSGAATTLTTFPLKDDSSATLDAIRVTIESGRGAIDLRTAGRALPSGRINTYLVDGRPVDVSVDALRLEWPEDAEDFAGRIRIEASDTLDSWRVVSAAAPVANLHSNGQRLLEQRVGFAPTKARYWRLSWSGSAAPFVLSAVLAEPAKQAAEAHHNSFKAAAVAARAAAGEFAYDLGANLPVDRLNLELPDINTVVDVELLSRNRPEEPWHPVRRAGFYRLQGNGEELRNGSLPIALNTDRYWLIRTDPQGGGLGATAPRLVVDWVPHEVVFVARGTGPFFVAYGSSTVSAAAVSLAALPKDVTIAPASLADPQFSGGDSRLQPPPASYPWKTALLWGILLVAAGLLGWMAWRLSRDFSRGR